MSYRHGERAHVASEDFPIEPFTSNKEASRLLLDRAVIRMQQGDARGSLIDTSMALDAMDYYRDILFYEKTSQLLIDDQQSPYLAKYYETLFARIYAAFACYQLNELDNAFAFLKQAMVQEDLQIEQNKRQDRSPLLAYLMAIHLEKQKDFSQAELFYKRAYHACPRKFIEVDLERVTAQKQNRDATVLCIVHKGLIPEKVSITAPASVASAAAVEILLSAWNIPPAFSSLTGITLPAFPQEIPQSTSRPIVVNNQLYKAEKIEDIFQLARQDLDEEIPQLAAQAVARQLLRRATVGVVREKHPLAGDVADLFALVANLATQADTRMWKTLPHEIHVLRVDVPPGTYHISYGTKGTTTVALQSGDLRVLQFFHPSN